MGLLGGFKAKFRSGQSRLKNTTNVVCVKYNVTQEFDPQPGQSSSYHDIGAGNKEFKPPRVKTPYRGNINGIVKLPQPINAGKQPEIEAKKENTHEVPKQVLSETKQPHINVEREFANGAHSDKIINKQQVEASEELRKPDKEPRKYLENGVQNQVSGETHKQTETITQPQRVEEAPPKINFSTHPLITGNTPTEELFKFDPELTKKTERPTTLQLNSPLNEKLQSYSRESTDEEEADEDEAENGNFKIHIASHNKQYETDEEETEDELELEPSPPLSPMDYSSQAASIFFGDDDDEEAAEEIVQRPRNLKVHYEDEDEDKSSVGSSASA